MSRYLCHGLAILALAAAFDSSAASAHKKHPAAASNPLHGSQLRRSQPHGPPQHGSGHNRHAAPAGGAAGTGTASRKHAHLRYSGGRIDAARKAAILEEIGMLLKEPAAHAIAYRPALDGFYAQLASHEAELRDSGSRAGTVRVLQFGDSHTAADMFTGEARRVFQLQFGDGGIGYSYAGHPFAGYRILGSARAQSAGWKTQGNKFLQLGDGLTGLGGIRISTERPGEWASLEASCTGLELEYLEQPGGGSLRFTDNDGDAVEISTAAAEIGPGTFRYTCSPGEHTFKVTTAQYAPVSLLGWVATQPGVTWESIGINGAEAPLILKWDQKLFSSYLQANSPALIVLAYGTNEAASAYWDEESYRQTFASIIDTLHQYVPESSLLVVGPADRSTSQHRAWHPYSGTERIIQAQRAVCRTHGCAYWDQRQRMGGLGSMQDWVYAGWAQPDHTHFTGEGYRELADTLMADLLSGYAEYKRRNAIDSQTQAHGASNGTPSANR